MADLFPTPSRRALLAAIHAGEVTGYPYYKSDQVDYYLDDLPGHELKVTKRIEEFIRAGWVTPPPGGERRPDFKPGLMEPGWLVLAMSSLSVEEKVEYDRMLGELHSSGYQDIAEHKALKPGTRIRHSGHQWPEAIDKGTGVVVALTEKPESAWSESWGRADIELIALWDKPQPFARLSQLAQYHVVAVPHGQS